MKGILLLAIVLGAVLALFGIVVSSPPEQTKVAGVMAVTFFGALGFALRGPLGRAIATLLGAGDDHRTGEQQARLAAQVDDLMEEVRATREELVELQERLDFTEWLLASGENRGGSVPLGDRPAGGSDRAR